MCFSVSIQSLDKFDLRVLCRTCSWTQSVLRSHRNSNTLKHLDSPLQSETFLIDRRINILHSSLMQSTIESCSLLLKHIVPSSFCVNSRQICDDILRDLNLVMNGNIESYPDLFSGCLNKCSRVSTAAITSVVRRDNRDN